MKTSQILAVCCLAGSCAVLSTALPSFASAQTESTTATATCTLHDDLYTCDKASFQHVLTSAKTAAIETGPTDAFAQDKLKTLVAGMGKTLVPRGEHADITLLLVPVDPSGVSFNSDRAQLATLRVFAAQPDQSGRGALVWAENLNGNADTPWPAVVNQLTSQFRRDFGLKR